MKKFSKIGRRDPIPNIPMSQFHVKDLDHANCPYCNYGPINGVSQAEVHKEGESISFTAKPTKLEDLDGKCTICASCAELLVFRKKNDSITIDVPKSSEIEEWKTNEDLWKIINFSQKQIREKNGD